MVLPDRVEVFAEESGTGFVGSESKKEGIIRAATDALDVSRQTDTHLAVIPERNNSHGK